MKSSRTLAYELATVLDLNELDSITGGNAGDKIIIPTFFLTGMPSLPDMAHDKNGY